MRKTTNDYKIKFNLAFLVRHILLTVIILLNTFSSVFSQNKKAPEKPKLIIGIVIEGMRYDYLEKYSKLLGDQGFKRLLRNGFVFKNTNLEYLQTQPSSGHATIATGAYPSEHGIIADYWYNRKTKKTEYCADDKKVKILGTDSTEIGKSPRSLLASCFGDELKLSNFKRSKVIGIALNDYAAIFPAGFLANGAYWYSKDKGAWVSSSYYFEQMPYWVRRYNEKRFPDVFAKKTWTLGRDISDYKKSLADDNKYEKGYNGTLNTFPYYMSELKANMGYSYLSATPFGNTFVKDFAVSAIVNEDLGGDNYTDFLSISFDACGEISKAFGIRSIELADSYVKLDRDIENFLNFVDDYVGKENVLIYLTATRGDSDMPEFLTDINMPGDYFNNNNAESLTRSYVRAIYGTGKLVLAYTGNQMYLDQDASIKSKIKIHEIQENVASLLITLSGVNKAVTAAKLEQNSYSTGIMAKFYNSFNSKRSGDVILNFSTGVRIKSYPYFGNGYRDYTHVPLIWYGWKIKTGESNQKNDIINISATISDILGIAFPNAATGTPLDFIYSDK